MPDHYGINNTLNTSAALSLMEVTPELKKKAIRNVCGSPAVKDAADAKIILEALGLLDG